MRPRPASGLRKTTDLGVRGSTPLGRARFSTGRSPSILSILKPAANRTQEGRCRGDATPRLPINSALGLKASHPSAVWAGSI